MEGTMIVIRSGPERLARVAEGLRLSAAMLGMDSAPVIVFLDDGVECLRRGTFTDPTILEYLLVASDMAGIHALSDSVSERGVTDGDLEPEVKMFRVNVDWIASEMAECGSVVTF
ncbi:MAG TPA: DsrE family protein [Patescibacteria group bacterium]|nr:DsrE family protein [Patescibacteria group bacterium]